MRLDVTDQGEVDAARRTIEAEPGRVDALVNNAGAFYDTFENAVDADLDIVEQAWQVNCVGALDEGADTLVWAATLPAGGPTGGFFRDRRRTPW